ncbi:MAG: hypothetical protein EOO90_15465 [Pedobacter sp.]|nr:MAG: hypothetical protein EOO90_15465 [Pedobacter sp.]
MKPSELWKLSSSEFNKYRRENDLKNLFEVFEKKLPLFNEWLESHKFSIDFILSTDKPGSFFYGLTDIILFKYENEGRIYFSFYAIEDEAHDKRLKKVKLEDNQQVFQFTPYLIWAQTKLGKKKIIPAAHSGEVDSFIFNIINAPDVPEISRNTIVPGFKVIKLGATEVDNAWALVDRNLDFADLDFLEIKSDSGSNREINILYSSCRHMKITNSEINFTTFKGCHFFNLVVNNSRMYHVNFENCDLFKVDFNEAQLSNLAIEMCSVSGISFNKVEVDNLIYNPPKEERHVNKIGTYQNVADNYKRLRVLYQNNGHRVETSDAYFMERLYEYKYNLHSMRFFAAFKQIWKVDFNYAWPDIRENFTKLWNVIADFISLLIWGFGEKPFRTLLFTLATVIIYSLIYYFSDVTAIGGNYRNCLYLSSIMFSTLGFGDYTPFATSDLKLVLASESLIGAFTFGLFIAGYANKSKY